MTCYFRHLGPIFEKAGIEIKKQNRKEVATFISETLGVSGDCSEIWREIKKRITENESDLVTELKTAWEKRTIKT